MEDLTARAGRRRHPSRMRSVSSRPAVPGLAPRCGLGPRPDGLRRGLLHRCAGLFNAGVMTANDEKAARLASALRANLARRKGQMRARRDAEIAAPSSDLSPSDPVAGAAPLGADPASAQADAPDRAQGDAGDGESRQKDAAADAVSGTGNDPAPGSGAAEPSRR